MDNPGDWKFRIFGDSIMRGIVYDAERDQYIPAPRALSFSHGGACHIEVKNNSVFGSTIVKGANLLNRAVEKGLSSDIVLIEFGGNDCNLRWREVFQDPHKDHQPRTPLPLFEATLISMISVIRGQGAIPIVMNLPPIDSDRYMHHICKDGRNMDTLLSWFDHRTSMNTSHETYSAAIERIADETYTHLIDIRSAFLSLEDYRSMLSEDGVHPTIQGYQLIDKKVSEYVRTIIRHNRSRMHAFVPDRAMFFRNEPIVS